MDKNDTSGFWVFKNVDQLQEFFTLKVAIEKKLGRVLTGNEVHDLAKGMQTAGTIKGFELKNGEISEDSLGKLIDLLPKKKREDDKNV